MQMWSGLEEGDRGLEKMVQLVKANAVTAGRS